MAISWTSPGVLWLLVIAPLVWAASRFGRTNFNRRQQIVQTSVRMLLLAALALALARPVVSTGSSRLSVVYLVDVSHSIATPAIRTAADRITALNDAVRPAHWRIVAFAADAVVVDNVTALKALADIEPASGAAPAIQRDGTDLDRGLSEARSELAPGHLPRIVLFTDGHETAGAVSEAIARLAAEGLPVSVEPLAARELGDSWVDRIALPDRLTTGALMTAAVGIGSQRPASGTLELREGDRVLATRAVTLSAGLTTVSLDVTFDGPGARVVDVDLDVAGDPLAANNRLSVEAVVRPRPHVLYVEGSPASARYLQGALTQAGFDVTVKTPADVPASAALLDAWDVVILSDVARAVISDASMTALSSWVEQQGGGLLVAGGESVFGEDTSGTLGGYRHTELERLMPVTFERKDEPEVALIIVLDKSWSMAGQVMELCKAAAQAAIKVLSDEQSIGIITFNDGFNWDVSLRNVGKNRDAILKTVAVIEPSGHTLIYPAVEQAFLALRDARARAKHVVLLSDGRSYPDDYEGLVKRMADAKITVSTIAVGPAADAELLSNIAKWGRGRNYAVEDAREVPQIFVKEAKNAAAPAFDEKPLKPVLKMKGFLEGVDVARAPNLRGRTATVLKDGALELLSTEDGDPLLAFWPIGLGRTAVFASDVKDRWAHEWIQWRGYGPFFSALVHALERQRPPALSVEIVDATARGNARTIGVGVEARDAKGAHRNLLKPAVELRAGDQAAATVQARQVAPGRYEARLAADAREMLTVRVSGPGETPQSRLIVPDLKAEYRFRPPDEARLQSIAQATGGTWKPTPETLRQAGGVQTARRALWPALVAIALGLWLVDILIRRVRFLEPVS